MIHVWAQKVYPIITTPDCNPYMENPYTETPTWESLVEILIAAPICNP